jgi:hypothetical protein
MSNFLKVSHEEKMRRRATMADISSQFEGWLSYFLP